MITVAHNLVAMNAQRQFNITSNSKAKTTEKLSSGYRINRAADDAAGLAISEKMRRQIRGLNQGTNNIQDGISTTQIMDGSLNEVSDILQRMTELSVKAANETLNPEDRMAIENEIKQLKVELNRTTDNANFNGKPLLKAGDITTLAPTTSKSGKADVVFVIDNTGSMTSYVNNVINNLESFANGLSTCDVRYGVVVYGEETEGPATSKPFTDSVSTFKDNLRSIPITGGGDTNESALEGILAATAFPFRADSSKEYILVTDAPYHDKDGDGLSSHTASEIMGKINAQGARLTVVTDPGYVSLYSSKLSNGNVLNMRGDFHDSLVNLAKDITETAGGIYHKNPADIRIQMSSETNDYYMIKTFDVSTASLGIEGLTCLTEEDARAGIDMIKFAISKLSTYRASIGADQNALEHAYNMNGNVAENTTAAESAIRDADMADEMVTFSMQNILGQAGISMMSQANSINQDILALLQ